MEKWIKAGIIFVLGAVAQRILDRFLDWSEIALLPSILGMSFSDLLLALGIVVGAILIAWGVWESKRQTKKEKPLTAKKPPLEWIKIKLRVQKPKYDFSSFDESFKALKQTTQPKTKETMLADFQNKLSSLCDVDWNDQVKTRIVKVLEYIIPKKLSDDLNINYYLLYLSMMMNPRYIGHTRSMVEEGFLVELENLYNDPKFETNSKILSLLQELHEFSEEYMTKLINDASTQWSDQRFQALGGNIELWELKNRDKEAHKRVSSYIRLKMDDAERNKDEKTYDRLKKLYELASR